MTKTKYEPHPVDTSDISLPAELTPLIDDMCRNVHEVWAATRIAQGWTYGTRRDDAAKHRVCEIALEAKPGFLKTSTGRSFGGADQALLEDV